MLGLWAAIGFAAVCGAIQLAPDLSTDAAGVMLFIGLLPLLNAAADFASVGLTRYFLAQGVVRHRPVWAAAKDLACGLIIFALLGCAIIATLHFVRPADGVPLLNLAALFADLHANPGAYWWLGFMLFSTLLPTLAHATLGLFTLFTLAPPGLRGWIADQFEKGGAGDVVAGRYGYVALCVLATAAIVLPLYALWQAVRHSPRAVDAVIAGFEAFARLIGAV